MQLRSRAYKERRKRSSYEEVMNFRSLLIILYLFLIQNSEALSERVIDLIRGTRRVLEYAPRTPRVSTSQQVASDDACAYELEAVRAAYCCTPRVIEASSLL